MLQPARTKYRKAHKGDMKGESQRGSTLAFGTYGLKATERGKITSRQIESARIAIVRHIKRGGKIWIRIFPDHPVTKKPLETRMGKGKGGVEYYICKIRPGRILYEMDFPDEASANEALRLASHKLPVKCRIVKRTSEIFS